MLRSATLLAVALVWSTDAFHGASRWTAPQRMGPLASSSEAAAPSTETSPPSSTDCLVSALSADGLVSAKAVVSTELVRTIVGKQEALPLAASACAVFHMPAQWVWGVGHISACRGFRRDMR